MRLTVVIDDDSPNALCFGGAFPPSGAPCLATVTADGLQLVFPAHPSADPRRVAFDRLAVGAGGFDHDHLVVKWDEEGTPFTLYLKDPDVIRAFRTRASGTLSAELHRTAEEVRRRRMRRRAFLWAGLAMVGGLFLALWLGSDRVAEFAVARIPVSWEESIGEASYRQFIMGHTVVEAGPAVEAIDVIAARLTGALQPSPYRFQISVVNSGVVNAFALPGGRVVVFTGLLRKADSAEEVAGVLAHEVNHVLKRHAMVRVAKRLGLVGVVTMLTGNEQGLAGLIKDLGIELATLKFGREQETEADEEGLRLLHRARVAPEGMVSFFERLAEQDAPQLEILSSHPMSEGRAERLRAEIARLPRMTPEPVPVDWVHVRASLRAP